MEVIGSTGELLLDLCSSLLEVLPPLVVDRDRDSWFHEPAELDCVACGDRVTDRPCDGKANWTRRVSGFLFASMMVGPLSGGSATAEAGENESTTKRSQLKQARLVATAAAARRSSRSAGVAGRS